MQKSLNSNKRRRLCTSQQLCLALRRESTSLLLFVLLTLPLVPVLVSTLGCERFRTGDTRGSKSELRLPQPVMEAGSVALEIAVVQLDHLQEPVFKSFLRRSDQQKLSLDQRMLLDENGMAASILSSTSSMELDELLTPRVMQPQWLNDRDRELAAAGKLKPVDRFVSIRRVEKKIGEQFPIEVSPLHPLATWNVYSGSGIVSGTQQMAQCYFQVTAWPRPDGTVRFVFVPQIHYGPKRTQIGVSGSDFTFEDRHAVEEFPELEFAVTLRQSETLLVCPTRKLERLGELFFSAVPNDSVNESSSQFEDEVDALLDETDDFADLAELFPMLETETETGDKRSSTSLSNRDPAVLLEIDELDDLQLDDLKTESLALDESGKSVPIQRSAPPRPWQRFLLLRIVESKPLK